MTEKQKISVIYHSLFGYALSKEELRKWVAGPKLRLGSKYQVVSSKQKKAQNTEKLKIAKKASKIISKIPTVLFVGITGSLAMNNAKEESDIDLMIITKANTLWITRLITYLVLSIMYYVLGDKSFKTRKPKNKDEKDRICLNLWLDELNLSWSFPKNAYIAHEISQVVPLINKNGVYQKWLSSNIWIRSYWPNAVKKITNTQNDFVGKFQILNENLILKILNYLCYLVQMIYMKPKITRESISLHHAFFHPYDWGERVMKELKAEGVVEV